MERIGAAIAAGDTGLAERIAHSLRGAAGNLGAMPVAEAAQALEEALRHHREHRALLPALAQPLSTLLAAIAAQNGDGNGDDGGGALDGESLQQLLRLLESGDAEAEQVFHTLRIGLRARLGGERYRTLARAIAQFEFDAALKTIRSLMETVP